VPSGGDGHWLVTEIDAAAAGARLRQMLHDPNTYGQ